jgi:hypothetical protein
VSEPDVTLLARNTRLLLRCYPKAYRAHRGEEILGTLLETTRPGRGWPPAREVASVISGGLQARRAANLNQGLRASLRHVAILAVAMIVVDVPAVWLYEVGQHIAGPSLPSVPPVVPGLTLESLLVMTALAAAWCGRRWPVAVAAAATTVIAVAVLAAAASRVVVRGGTTITVAGMGVLAALALMILVPLIKRAGRPPASLLWLPCLPVAVSFVEGLGAASGLPRYDSLPFGLLREETLLSPYYTYLSLVPVLVAVCWLVTDVRPLAALAVAALLTRALGIAVDSVPGHSRTQLPIVAGLLLLALTCALVWLLRHRARTAPPPSGNPLS